MEVDWERGEAAVEVVELCEQLGVYPVWEEETECTKETIELVELALCEEDKNPRANGTLKMTRRREASILQR